MSNEKSVFLFEEETNNYLKSRAPINLNVIYNYLKNLYPLVLTSTFSIENGKTDFDDDFPILMGKSSSGKFQLYDNGLYVIFDVEKTDGTYIHWHPTNEETAIKDIISFMEGKLKAN